jgi:hypothetical protein
MTRAYDFPVRPPEGESGQRNQIGQQPQNDSEYHDHASPRAHVFGGPAPAAASEARINSAKLRH